MNSPIRVMVTIDTEEDDWGSYRSTGASVSNIALLPDLAQLWSRFGVKPTYFVNYPPMALPEASRVLLSLDRESACEMAVHCHPWNTPPFEDGTRSRPSTMMNGLPEEENHAKLSSLTTLFQDTFGRSPGCFRAGRWGLGPSVSRPLHRLGYEADFSVSPFMDWSAFGGPDYSGASQFPYRFDPDNPFVPEGEGALVEIPTSVGFLRGPQRASATMRRALERSTLARFKVVGLLDSLGLFARRWISPETSSSGEMIRLANALIRNGLRVLDLTFHSSTLLPAATPFVRNAEDKTRFVKTIERFLEFAAAEGFLFSTAGEVAKAVATGELH